MPKPLAVDSGSFNARLNARDKHHALAIAFFKARGERLATPWPVITEVCHLAPQPARSAFLRWAAAGGAAVFHLPDNRCARGWRDLLTHAKAEGVAAAESAAALLR